RFWYRTLWKVTANWGSRPLRFAARLFYVVALLLIVAVAFDSVRMGHGRILPRPNLISIFTGLWFSSALFGYLAVKFMRGIEVLWTSLRSGLRANSTGAIRPPTSASA